MDPYRLIRPALFAADPEKAHAIALGALKLGLASRQGAPDPPSLRQTLFGLDFPNPVGMAAGFDKDAEVPGALVRLGFGFVEVGTVTPRPQPGNPSPRVFRSPADRALINRLGFNSQGHEAAHRRLAARARSGIVGVNIGANKDSADRVGDYAAGVARFHGLADYLTVNISSPNTPGLRELQGEGELAGLLDAAMAARPGTSGTPIMVKIAPDLSDAALGAIIETVIGRDIAGLIVSNTTLARDGLTDAAFAGEVGGLSGAPLFALSTRMLARARVMSEGRLPLIGVGGISSGADVLTKIKAGASLVQLYTAMVFEGPGIVARIKRELGALLKSEGFASLGEAVGVEAGALRDFAP